MGKGQAQIFAVLSNPLAQAAIVAFAAGALTGVGVTGGYDALDSEWRDKYLEAEENLSEAKSQIDELREDVADLQQDKGSLRNDIRDLNESLREERNENDRLQKELENKTDTIESLRNQINGTIDFRDIRKYQITNLPATWIFLGQESITDLHKFLINIPISITLFGFSGVFGVVGRIGYKTTKNKYVGYLTYLAYATAIGSGIFMMISLGG